MRKLISMLLAAMLWISASVPVFAQDNADLYLTVSVKYSDQPDAVEQLSTYSTNGIFYANAPQLAQRLGYVLEDNGDHFLLKSQSFGEEIRMSPGSNAASRKVLSTMLEGYQAPAAVIRNDQGLWIPLDWGLQMMGSSLAVSDAVLDIAMPQSTVLSSLEKTINGADAFRFDWEKDYAKFSGSESENGGSESLTADQAVKGLSAMNSLLAADGSMWLDLFQNTGTNANGIDACAADVLDTDQENVSNKTAEYWEQFTPDSSFFQNLSRDEKFNLALSISKANEEAYLSYLQKLSLLQKTEQTETDGNGTDAQMPSEQTEQSEEAESGQNEQQENQKEQQENTEESRNEEQDSSSGESENSTLQESGQSSESSTDQTFAAIEINARSLNDLAKEADVLLKTAHAARELGLALAKEDFKNSSQTSQPQYEARTALDAQIRELITGLSNANPENTSRVFGFLPADNQQFLQKANDQNLVEWSKQFDGLGMSLFVILPTNFETARAALESGGFKLSDDGTFTGSYGSYHSNETAEYVESSDFTGRFGKPKKITEFIYSVTLESLQYEKEPGTQSVEDVGHSKPFPRYTDYVESPGIKNGTEYLIYLPGCPVEQLPEKCRQKVAYLKGPVLEDNYFFLYSTAEDWVHTAGDASSHFAIKD